MSRRFVAALYGVDIAFAMLACSSTAGHERDAQPVRTARDRHSLTLPPRSNGSRLEAPQTGSIFSP